MNWDQLRAMLWLRWRLTRNQWRRGGQLNAVITLILLVIGLGAGRGRRHRRRGWAARWACPRHRRGA